MKQKQQQIQTRNETCWLWKSDVCKNHWSSGVFIFCLLNESCIHPLKCDQIWFGSFDRAAEHQSQQCSNGQIISRQTLCGRPSSHLYGSLPAGDGELGGVGPLGATDVVLVINDLYNDQPHPAHNARSNKDEHLYRPQIMCQSIKKTHVWRNIYWIYRDFNIFIYVFLWKIKATGTFLYRSCFRLLFFGTVSSNGIIEYKILYNDRDITFLKSCYKEELPG